MSVLSRWDVGPATLAIPGFPRQIGAREYDAPLGDLVRQYHHHLSTPFFLRWLPQWQVDESKMRAMLDLVRIRLAI